MYRGYNLDIVALIMPKKSRYVFQFQKTHLIIFFDWHDTLDCALNALKVFDSSIIDGFAQLVQLACGRIEFHIVSYSGQARGRQTEEDANNPAHYCRQQGVPFRTVAVVGDPVGPGGKVPILTLTGSHIHCDDHADVCTDARRANIHAIHVYKLESLPWWPQLYNFVRDKGVHWIVQNHTVTLRGA